MYHPPRADFEPEPREGAPIRALLIAVPLGIGLWAGIFALAAFLR